MSADLATLPPAVSDRFWSHVDKSGACWVWTGYKSRGYGRFYMGGRRHLAHRVAYKALVGQIPEGLTIDHLCRNKPCVNPAHMEVVTRGENALRGGGGAVASANRRAKTHCINGHEYTKENTRTIRNGSRQCKTCGRDQSREWWRREAAK